MKTISLGLCALLLMPMPALAQNDESLRAAAIRSASVVASSTDPAGQSADDWGKVRRLEEGSQVRVTLRDGSVREGRLGTVNDDSMLVNAASIPRDAIDRVERRTRGSIIGGVIGAAAGAFAGVFTAASLAFKQCGESCGDEKLLMIGAVIGMPVAGGYLGAKLAPRKPWTTVYRGR